jgi:hypothetical protein
MIDANAAGVSGSNSPAFGNEERHDDLQSGFEGKLGSFRQIPSCANVFLRDQQTHWNELGSGVFRNFSRGQRLASPMGGHLRA